jgi:cytoskeletal protein CcmA (bactofilin family)
MADQATFIGQQTVVRGTLSGEEDLVVEGRLEGAGALGGRLAFQEGARVSGRVTPESPAEDVG